MFGLMDNYYKIIKRIQIFGNIKKGLISEYYQIYTKEGSTKVDQDPEWTKSIGKPITQFQSNFDLDHLIREDTNANPILLGSWSCIY